MPRDYKVFLKDILQAIARIIMCRVGTAHHECGKQVGDIHPA